MAKQITVWEDNQGRLHRSAIEAANADADFELRQALTELTDDSPIGVDPDILTQWLYERKEELRKALSIK